MSKRCSKCLRKLSCGNSTTYKKRVGGYCIQCTKIYSESYHKRNIAKCHARKRTTRYRHARIVSLLRKERVPKTDLLWSLNFYRQLILDNLCCYCDGKLDDMGGSLDAADNSIGHRCYNVVPCCWKCNRKKMDDISYEDMIEIKPWLKKIRSRQEG